MAETTPAGAMPVAEGATPSQTPPANPAPTTPPGTPPATGDADGLGDAGKRAIEAERATARSEKARADKAERALADLQNATASDTEKALKAAKAEGAAEVTAKWSAQVRRSEVRTALTAAGVNPALLDLAARADEFMALKVDDDGEVEGLAEAVEAFKKKMPDLFKTAQRPDFGGGQRGNTPASAPGMNELLRAAARNG